MDRQPVSFGGTRGWQRKVPQERDDATSAIAKHKCFKYGDHVMIKFIQRALVLLITVTPFIFIKAALAGFPVSSGGSSYCFFGCSPTSTGGSTIVFDFNPDNESGLAPVAINFFPYPDNESMGDLCWSGKVHATIYNYINGTNPTSGTATYDILSSTGENKGMCYSNVVRTLKSDGMLGDCPTKIYIYSLVLNDTELSPGGTYNNSTLASLLNGRFKVDPNYSTEGAYNICDTTPGTNICDIETGFGVYNNTPAFIGFENLFPAEMTLSGDMTEDGQVLFADEVRAECTLDDVGVDPSQAVDAKSAKIFLSETLSMNASWCTDLQSANPDCNAFNAEGERTVGSVKTSIGDFQQQNVDVTCVDSIADLQNLEACTTELAIATCADSTTGFMTFPQAYEWPVACSDGSDASLFSYSSAEGGGSNIVNLAAIGADAGAPGYIGDNTIPPVLPGWTAIVSTPDNQVNIWDFSDVDLVQVAFIHVRNNDDEVTGSKANDTILGGSGADTLNGNDGDDILQGGDNTDVLNGDDGNDLLLGYECNSINATCGSYLNNGSDDDVLNGGLGNDCLDGGRGNDTYTGGLGADAFVLFGNSDTDIVDDFDGSEGDKIIDMTGSATMKWIKGSKKDGIENFCAVSTGGNNVMIMDGYNTSQGTCNSLGSYIVDVTDGGTLPAQCAGHPFTYLP
jgi:hypothetical protein